MSWLWGGAGGAVRGVGAALKGCGVFFFGGRGARV